MLVICEVKRYDLSPKDLTKRKWGGNELKLTKLFAISARLLNIPSMLVFSDDSDFPLIVSFTKNSLLVFLPFEL